MAAIAELSTRSFGLFRIQIHTPTWQAGNDTVISKGDVSTAAPVLCRVTSACTLSTAFDASDCDCREQLHDAMRMINENGRGIVIYLDQEGRGHGLHTKVRALRNKNDGYDTLSAIEALGLEADVTDYRDVPAYLDSLGARSLRLLTNNPMKVDALSRVGVDIEDVLPCLPADVHPDAKRHLAAKRDRGHAIPKR